MEVDWECSHSQLVQFTFIVSHIIAGKEPLL